VGPAERVAAAGGNRAGSGIGLMHRWKWGLRVVKASELVPGDVVVVAGERLRVTSLPRVVGTTAVVDTVSATESVTVYLRAAGTVTLDRPSPARRPGCSPAGVAAPAPLAASPRASAQATRRRVAS
jgi:hypothetical protein